MTTVIQPGTTSVIAPGAAKLLHAFPENSNVALCGRRLVDGQITTWSTARCQACERLAGEKWFLGR